MTTDTTPAGGRPFGSPRKILCAVDLSDFAAPVLAHATALARDYGAEVAVLHVHAAWAPPASLASYPGWMTQVPEAREMIANELRTLIAPFMADGTPLPLWTAVGDAAKEIVRHASEWRADLLVIGTHGRSGYDRFALGSVAEKVLRKAPCPVLTLPLRVARDVDDVAYRHILCPTDFSDCSARALDVAVALAAKRDADVTVLHVVDALDGEEEWNGPNYVVEFRRLQSEGARHAMQQLLAPHSNAACRIEEVVILGRAHREILRIAAERRTDLIVMGVRGRGPVDLTLFGSTTNHVVRRATCPVMTVRAC